MEPPEFIRLEELERYLTDGSVKHEIPKDTVTKISEDAVTEISEDAVIEISEDAVTEVSETVHVSGGHNTVYYFDESLDEQEDVLNDEAKWERTDEQQVVILDEQQPSPQMFVTSGIRTPGSNEELEIESPENDLLISEESENQSSENCNIKVISSKQTPHDVIVIENDEDDNRKNDALETSIHPKLFSARRPPRACSTHFEESGPIRSPDLHSRQKKRHARNPRYQSEYFTYLHNRLRYFASLQHRTLANSATSESGSQTSDVQKATCCNGPNNFSRNADPMNQKCVSGSQDFRKPLYIREEHQNPVSQQHTYSSQPENFQTTTNIPNDQQKSPFNLNFFPAPANFHSNPDVPNETQTTGPRQPVTFHESIDVNRTPNFPIKNQQNPLFTNSIYVSKRPQLSKHPNFPVLQFPFDNIPPPNFHPADSATTSHLGSYNIKRNNGSRLQNNPFINRGSDQTYCEPTIHNVTNINTTIVISNKKNMKTNRDTEIHNNPSSGSANKSSRIIGSNKGNMLGNDHYINKNNKEEFRQNSVSAYTTKNVKIGITTIPNVESKKMCHSRDINSKSESKELLYDKSSRSNFVKYSYDRVKSCTEYPKMIPATGKSYLIECTTCGCLRASPSTMHRHVKKSHQLTSVTREEIYEYPKVKISNWEFEHI